ncbi:Suppressor of the cold-sensitive snRNP bioproteinsis mutant brr1-1, partial [Perkinsus olseni]
EVCQYLADAAEALNIDVICEPNYAMQLDASSEESFLSNSRAASELSALGVNDRFASEQWNLERIGMKEAWEALEDQRLRDVVVAVVDTGVEYEHEDLVGSMMYRDGEILGYDFVKWERNPYDSYGHGTRCAGIIAAQTNNTLGVAGIAPVKIIPIKIFFDSGGTFLDKVLFGLDLAMLLGANVSVTAYRFEGRSEALKSAAERASQRGHLIIAAPGITIPGIELNVNSSSPCSLAAELPVLCVASTNKRDEISRFSNYANFTHIVAPGEYVYSTSIGNTYTSHLGSSVPASHVAGVAALLFGLGLTLPEVVETLLDSSDDVVKFRNGTAFPYAGRLNAGRAVRQALARQSTTASPSTTTTTPTTVGTPTKS